MRQLDKVADRPSPNGKGSRKRYAALSYALAALAPALLSLAMDAWRLLSPSELYLLIIPLVIAASVLRGLSGGALAATSGAAGLGLSTDAHLDQPRLALFVFLAAVAIAGGAWAFAARRRAQTALAALREREALMRSIFDTAPDAMIVIDEHAIVQAFSASAERTFGWDAADVLGRNVSMLMSEMDRSGHDGYVRHYIDTGEKSIIGVGRVVTGRRKNGATFPMELHIGELSTPHGRMFTGFARDLSDRQATEARVQEMQAELIHISRLSAMGEMTSALAHELNQPLSANANYIAGARRMLESGALDGPRLQQALAKASEQVLRAGEIIRRMREFIRRGEGERRTESLPQLVREACELALIGAKPDNIDVQFEFDADAEFVFVDRVQIQQVILNLVRNAIEAMSENAGARRLLLSTTRAPGEDKAIVKVSDSGHGLTRDAMAQLFQPFVTTKSEGMGLGLSISRTIVEAHEGRIWAEQNAMGGTTFGFSLRLASHPNG